MDDRAASIIAAEALAEGIAAACKVDPDRAFATLCCIPDNMLVLLDSPQGWTALASYVLQDLGRAGDYVPRVH